MEKNLNNLEQNESDILVRKGFFFDCKILGIKFKLRIKPVVLDTLLHCNDCAVKMKPIESESESVGDYIFHMNDEIIMKSEFIACAVLHKGWKIKIFKKLVAKIIRKNLTPKQTSEMVVAILQMYDLANFIPSTRLITTTTLTKPKTKNQETPNRVDMNAGV